MTAQSDPDSAAGGGWAALSAPDLGRALLLPLDPAIRAAGRALVQPARDRAAALGDRAPEDLLAGNAYLALALDPPDTPAAAAALAALAVLLECTAVLATVRRDGQVLDCAIESHPTETPAALRARAARAAGLDPGQLRPGKTAGARASGQLADDSGTA